MNFGFLHSKKNKDIRPKARWVGLFFLEHPAGRMDLDEGLGVTAQMFKEMSEDELKHWLARHITWYQQQEVS